MEVGSGAGREGEGEGMGVEGRERWCRRRKSEIGNKRRRERSEESVVRSLSEGDGIAVKNLCR